MNATAVTTFSFASQAAQYPARGPKGIGYLEGPDGIGCVLYRDKHGKLRGILNYYSQPLPPYERAGNINIFVDPRFTRRGIATRLLDEALRRWPKIDLGAQRYTMSGARFIAAYMESLDARVAQLAGDPAGC